MIKNVKLFTVLLLFWSSIAFSQTQNPPKLILQITVDQLRGDMPNKYLKNMGRWRFPLLNG